MSRLKKATSTTQRALVPIERIPYDVLRLIFEEAAQEKEDRLAQIRFALYMSSICQTWRDVANDLPSLWSTIHISLENAPPLTLLELILRRSQLCLLDIFVEWTAPGELFLPRGANRDPRTRESSYILPAIYLLMQHISRWKSVDITWNPSVACLPASIDGLFVSRHLMTAGALEDMKVRGMDFFGRLLSAPHLHSLEVEGIPSNCNFGKLALRCPALSDFTWRELGREEYCEDPSEILKYLRPLAGQLQRLKLGQFKFTDPYMPEGEPSTFFPMLKILEFSVLDAAEVDGFLEGMTAPHLEELVVCDIWESKREDWNLSDHFTRLPSLRSLCIEPVEDPGVHYNGYSLKFLNVFHSVRINYGVNHRKAEMERIIRMLSRGHKQVWLFPNLVSVKIYCTAAFPTGLLRKLVEGRIKGPVRALRELTVHNKRIFQLHAPQREWFQDNLSTFTWTSDFPSRDVDPLAVRYPDGHNAIELVNLERDE